MCAPDVISDSEAVNSVVDQLYAESEGVFVWVGLAESSLKDTRSSSSGNGLSAAAVLKAAKGLGLDSLYAENFNRVWTGVAATALAVDPGADISPKHIRMPEPLEAIDPMDIDSPERLVNMVWRILAVLVKTWWPHRSRFRSHTLQRWCWEET